MDFDKLLGGKYGRRDTPTSVAPEATGAHSEHVEAGEGTTTDKPADKPRAKRVAKK